jgi:MarR family transcriptional regulator, lower aerobic nicotinate degradation pathway regulator
MSSDAHADLTEVIDAIRSIIRTLRVSGRAAEQRLGISSAQLFILQALRESPGLSINELADLTFTHQSSVSMVVARLVDGKLVTRKTGRSDGRKVLVTLTPAGRAMIRRSPDAGQAQLVRALTAMPRAELSKLASNLGTLTAMVETQASGTERVRAVS